MQPAQHKEHGRNLECGDSSPLSVGGVCPGILKMNRCRHDDGKAAINRRTPHNTGQAMVESMIVLLLMMVVFLGVFQFFYAAAARDILDHAAARAARAKTVGFNDWMVRKAVRVAAIPVSGAMLMPQEIPPDPGRAALANARTPGRAWNFALRTTPQSQQAALENALIPDYMASPHSNQAREILDYEAWESGAHQLQFRADLPNSFGTGGTITYTVWRTFDLLISWRDIARAVPTREAPGTITLEGRYQIESHYHYYLDDQGW